MKKIFIEILPSFLECSPSFIPTLRNRGYDVDYVYSEGSEASSREEFMRKFAGCDACILCIHHMTAEMMESAPNLKVIAVYGVGTDKIDIQAATKRGIAVVNAAGGNAVSVAEMTIGHMISLSRSIQRANIGMYTGIWKNYLVSWRVRSLNRNFSSSVIWKIILTLNVSWTHLLKIQGII